MEAQCHKQIMRSWCSDGIKCCLSNRMLGRLPKGLTIGIADTIIIAATALELGATLLTNNVEHYPFPDLTVIRGL